MAKIVRHESRTKKQKGRRAPGKIALLATRVSAAALQCAFLSGKARWALFALERARRR